MWPTWRSSTSDAAASAPSSLAVRAASAAPQHLHRVADRRQRVAELVRQRRQELVLAPVGLGEVVGELPGLGHQLALALDRASLLA